MHTDGNIVTEEGLVLKFDTFAELFEGLFTEDGNSYQVYYRGDMLDLIERYGLLKFTVAPPDKKTPLVEIPYSNRETVVSIKFNNRSKRGKKVAYILPFKLWLPPSGYSDKEFVDTMKELFKYLGIGTPTGPAAMGLDLIGKIWLERFGEDWVKHRHCSLPKGIAEVLKSKCMSSYVVTPGKGKEYPEGDEIDESMAYISQWRWLPSGTATILSRRPKTLSDMRDRCKYWIAECEVILHDYMEIGVMPIDADTHQLNKVGTKQATAPGTYIRWIDSQQADMITELGMEVTVLGGYMWRQMTDELSYFVDKLNELRNDAPNEFIAGVIKQIAVATNGAQGMSTYGQFLTNKHHPEAKEIRTVFSEAVPNKVYTFKKDRNRTFMTHWYWKAIAGTWARTAYLAHKFKDDLISADTDGLLVRSNPDALVYPPKEKRVRAGSYYRTRHTNIRNVNTRSYTSDQRDKRPGVPKNRR